MLPPSAAPEFFNLHPLSLFNIYRLPTIPTGLLYSGQDQDSAILINVCIWMHRNGCMRRPYSDTGRGPDSFLSRTSAAYVARPRFARREAIAVPAAISLDQN